MYPGLPLTRRIAAEGPMESNPAIRRHYDGPVDLLWPTYYIATALGRRPAALVRDILAGDPRFFEPPPDNDSEQKSYNYNDNEPLVRAIASGARGAYWDILRMQRTGITPDRAARGRLAPP